MVRRNWGRPDQANDAGRSADRVSAPRGYNSPWIDRSLTRSHGDHPRSRRVLWFTGIPGEIGRITTAGVAQSTRSAPPGSEVMGKRSARLGRYLCVQLQCLRGGVHGVLPALGHGVDRHSTFGEDGNGARSPIEKSAERVLQPGRGCPVHDELHRLLQGKCLLRSERDRVAGSAVRPPA